MLKHGIDKCRLCEHYISEEQGCTKCEFEWATEYPPTNDDCWDILNLDEDLEWSFLQIMDRLAYKDIHCLQVINWYGTDDVVVITGCRAYVGRIADALGVHEDSIVQDVDRGVCVVNLFKEKYLRGLL